MTEAKKYVSSQENLSFQPPARFYGTSIGCFHDFVQFLARQVSAALGTKLSTAALSWKDCRFVVLNFGQVDRAFFSADIVVQPRFLGPKRPIQLVR